MRMKIRRKGEICQPELVHARACGQTEFEDCKCGCSPWDYCMRPDDERERPQELLARLMDEVRN